MTEAEIKPKPPFNFDLIIWSTIGLMVKRGL